MTLFKSFFIALSTYSIIPVPQFEWKEKNMKYSIVFFPFVGILCGALLYAWYSFCRKIGLGSMMFSVVATVLPVFLTGGIHFDGYMDTVDALASHQSKEKKLEILKDSHCGAFSVVYCVVYFLLNLAFLYELYQLQTMIPLCTVYFFSRVLSALCAVCLPNARNSGMLYGYTVNAERKTIATIMMIIAIVYSATMLFWFPTLSGISVLFGWLSVFCYAGIIPKQFGGITGDTAGFFLQICELACIAGLWLGGMVL